MNEAFWSRVEEKKDFWTEVEGLLVEMKPLYKEKDQLDCSISILEDIRCLFNSLQEKLFKEGKRGRDYALLLLASFIRRQRGET